MCDLREIERLTCLLRSWVAREGRRLDQTGQADQMPTQLYLRRARLAEFVAEPEFREALRELRAIARERRG